MRKYDRNQIKKMYLQGYCNEEIADRAGCTIDTLYHILSQEGLTRTRGEECWKHPVYPIEIERYRKHLRVGEKIRAEIVRVDDDLRLKKIEEECTVIGIYKYFCLVRDRIGHRECVLYADLVVRERMME